VAIGFTTANIKFPVLYLLPYHHYLLCYGFDISGVYNQFFFPVVFLFIRFNKIKFSTDDLPAFLFIIINKDLIKNTLPPIIAAVWFFVGWPFHFWGSFIRIAGFIINNIYRLTIEFKLIQFSFYGNSFYYNISNISFDSNYLIKTGYTVVIIIT